MLFSLSVFILAAARLANASLSPTFPVSGDTCESGKDCQIKWIDNSSPPSASSMGETSIDLVTGDPKSLQIAQRLGGVSNPGTAKALTFTPDMTLSPTTQYAIRFISKANPSSPIFSTFFTITGGNGTGKLIAATTVDASNSSTSTSSIPGNNSSSTSTSTTNSTHGSTAATNTTSAAAKAASDKPSSSTRFSYSWGLILLVSPVIAFVL